MRYFSSKLNARRVHFVGVNADADATSYHAACAHHLFELCGYRTSVDVSALQEFSDVLRNDKSDVAKRYYLTPSEIRMAEELRDFIQAVTDNWMKAPAVLVLHNLNDGISVAYVNFWLAS